MIRSVLFLVAALFFGSVCGEVLTLDKALKTAASHPASKRTIYRTISQRLNFLNCHDLAFNNIDIVNSSENLPLYSLLQPIAAQQLEIMRRFFDVILSDVNFAIYNEKMASAFIRADRARVRSELGQYSDIDVAKLEAKYEAVRQARFASEKMQRLTRSQLAEAMGDIDNPVADLQEPEIRVKKIEPLEFDVLAANALKTNPVLHSADLSNDERVVKTMQLKQRLLTLVLHLEMLKYAKDNTEALAYYRELYLDRSRTLYEMEFKTDLGDSMTWQARVLFKETQVDFCIGLSYAELNALQNKSIWPL